MTFKELKDRFKHTPTDVAGIDVGLTSTKVVRLRKNGEHVDLIGAEVLPAADGRRTSVNLAGKLKARYAAITTSSDNAIIKLLTLPGSVDASFESHLAKNLGLEAGAGERISYRIVSSGGGRAESRVLAVSLPESEAVAVMQSFSSGLPAPHSLEVSPVAALTAFEAGPVKHSAEPAVGLLDFGNNATMLSIFYKKTLVLIRRFDFGVQKLLDRVTATLHVDAATAMNILSDNAFDISEPVAEMMGPFSSQLVVSRDFVERRENCTLKQLHVIGGIAASSAAIQELERALNLNVKLWDPFSIPLIQSNGFTLEPDEQRGRFASAIGAALGTFQESS